MPPVRIEHVQEDIQMVGKKYLSVSFALFSMIFHGIAFAENYTAIYINPNTLTFSNAQGITLEEASQIAGESCGSDCRRAGYSRNACVALAIRSGDGKCWGSNWGDSLQEARDKALQICRGYGCDCRIIFSECNR
jgi:hypothetical protein